MLSRPLFSMIARITARQMGTFKLQPGNLATVKATLPLVADVGPSFTAHFYNRMFAAHPELFDMFNKSNQQPAKDYAGCPMGDHSVQATKLFSSVATAATVAIEDGIFPADVLETICQRHAALGVQPAQYDVVGENILGTISELLTDDAAVLGAWGELYGQVAGAMIAREAQIYEELASTPGSWVGKRQFVLKDREMMSSDIARITFEPVDGRPVPEWRSGKYTTVWAKGEGWTNTQPRHYTLNTPLGGCDGSDQFCISVKKAGQGSVYSVSQFLHEAPIGSIHDLSAACGAFTMEDSEQIWLKDPSTPVVFLSGGVGITPVLAFLENMQNSQPVSWLHSEADGSTHAYRDRLQHLASVRDGKLQRRVWYENPTAEDGAPEPSNNLAKYHFQGQMALSNLDPRDLHLGNSDVHYYMCGGPHFVAGVTEQLTSLGVPDAQIHTEGVGS